MCPNPFDIIGVILNPASGSWKHFPDAGTPDGRAKLISQWFEGADCRIYETRGPGDGERQAALAATEGCTVVAAAGGDGTVREAISGLIHGSGLPLAIVPIGTANVLARAIGLPVGDIAACARIAVEGQERLLDVGLCNEIPFMLQAGIGLDGRVVRTVNKRIKEKLGAVAYVLNAISALCTATAPTCRITWRGDDPGKCEMLAHQLIAANFGLYGGAAQLGPLIDPTDGVLDLIVMQSAHSVRLRAAADCLALLRGGLLKRPSVLTHRFTSAEIECEPPADVQLDGDWVCQTPVRITVLPQALRVRVSR